MDLQKDTHPRTYPTIDITAQERVYLNLAANHAPASGNISTNHSCRTGGNLSDFQYNTNMMRLVNSYFAKTSVVKRGSFDISEQASSRDFLMSLYFRRISEVSSRENGSSEIQTFGETPLSRSSFITISRRVCKLSTHSISPHSSFNGVTA